MHNLNVSSELDALAKERLALRISIAGMRVSLVHRHALFAAQDRLAQVTTKLLALERAQLSAKARGDIDG